MGVAEKYTLTQGAVQWLVDKLKGSAQKQDVLTYEEIQASTDLTGKIASASVIKDGFFTLHQGAYESVQYIQVGKFVLVSINNLTINGDISLGIPTTCTDNISIALRCADNGKLATFYVGGAGRLYVYQAINYTAGFRYNGSFSYIAK